MTANWLIVEDYAQQIQEGKAFANIWTIGDLQSVEPGLTEDDAMGVLEYLEDHFDANIGINWDVIQQAIDIYIGRTERS